MRVRGGAKVAMSEVVVTLTLKNGPDEKSPPTLLLTWPIGRKGGLTAEVTKDVVEKWISIIEDFADKLSGGRRDALFATQTEYMAGQEERLTILGKEVFRHLVPGGGDGTPECREVGDYLSSKAKEGGVRLVFAWKPEDAEKLQAKWGIDPAQIPFETMVSPVALWFKGQEHNLVLAPTLTIARRIDSPCDRKGTSPVGVLLVVPRLDPENRESSIQLVLGEIIKAFEKLSETGKPSKSIGVLSEKPATYTNIKEMSKGREGVHIICHGRQADNGLELLFDPEENAQDDGAETAWIPLVDLIQELANNGVRWVLINGCWAGRLSSLAGRFDFVVAQQLPITHKAARAFNRGFYTEWVKSRSVEGAVLAGRNEIRASQRTKCEHCTPVLYIAPPVEDPPRPRCWLLVLLLAIVLAAGGFAGAFWRIPVFPPAERVAQGHSVPVGSMEEECGMSDHGQPVHRLLFKSIPTTASAKFNLKGISVAKHEAGTLELDLAWHAPDGVPPAAAHAVRLELKEGESVVGSTIIRLTPAQGQADWTTVTVPLRQLLPPTGWPWGEAPSLHLVFDASMNDALASGRLDVARIAIRPAFTGAFLWWILPPGGLGGLVLAWLCRKYIRPGR